MSEVWSKFEFRVVSSPKIIIQKNSNIIKKINRVVHEWKAEGSKHKHAWNLRSRIKPSRLTKKWRSKVQTLLKHVVPLPFMKGINIWYQNTSYCLHFFENTYLGVYFFPFSLTSMWTYYFTNLQQQYESYIY